MTGFVSNLKGRSPDRPFLFCAIQLSAVEQGTPLLRLGLGRHALRLGLAMLGPTQRRLFLTNGTGGTLARLAQVDDFAHSKCPIDGPQ